MRATGPPPCRHGGGARGMGGGLWHTYINIYIYTSGDPCISMHVGPVPGPGPTITC